MMDAEYTHQSAPYQAGPDASPTQRDDAAEDLRDYEAEGHPQRKEVARYPRGHGSHGGRRCSDQGPVFLRSLLLLPDLGFRLRSMSSKYQRAFLMMKSTTDFGSFGESGKCPSPALTITVIFPSSSL
jgi:hypothetical protein